MTPEQDQHKSENETEARTETSPEPPVTSPRGNVHSEPEEGDPGEPPPPLAA